jgi:short-subunit dehydrogenase
MVVVVNGASGGVGAAIAKRFAEGGYDIVLLGRNKIKLHNLSNILKKKYKRKVEYYTCDIEKEDTVHRCIANIQESNNKIDLLINVAGVFPYGPLMGISDDVYNNCMDVNLKLPLLLSVGLFNKLKKGGNSKVINIGSTSSYSGFKNTVLYCASKHAILGLSRALHDEWKEYGVTVHCISPGTIDTEMANALLQDKSTYIQVGEFSDLVYNTSQYSGNMIVEEVRATRREIK